MSDQPPRSPNTRTFATLAPSIFNDRPKPIERVAPGPHTRSEVSSEPSPATPRKDSSEQPAGRHPNLLLPSRRSKTLDLHPSTHRRHDLNPPQRRTSATQTTGTQRKHIEGRTKFFLAADDVHSALPVCEKFPGGSVEILNVLHSFACTINPRLKRIP